MVQKNSVDKILIITGPTASGKSKLSIKLAQQFNGEIIGCDSMQIYRCLNIGTGKITYAEKAGIPHFMIDIIPPNEEFSVGQYVKMCKNTIEDIISRKKIPIIVGGTGLYLSGLLFGYNYGNSVKSEAIRKKYEHILQDRGKEYLFSILKEIDPISSQTININDTKRTIRAIEIYELTGKPKSSIINKNDSFEYKYKMLALLPERRLLYENINNRVDEMISSGLVDEVKALYKYKHCQSMQAIGYKEIVEYLDGQTSLKDAIESIKINSRHYAKRQITYFKNMKADVDYIENYSPNDDNAIIDNIEKFLSEEL